MNFYTKKHVTWKGFDNSLCLCKSFNIIITTRHKSHSSNSWLAACNTVWSKDSPNQTTWGLSSPSQPSTWHLGSCSTGILASWADGSGALGVSEKTTLRFTTHLDWLLTLVSFKVLNWHIIISYNLLYSQLFILLFFIFSNFQTIKILFF